MPDKCKRWWRAINVYVYFFITFLLAFIVTYLVLVNFYSDSKVFTTTSVHYIYDDPSIPGLCTGMIVQIKENQSFAQFKTCIFSIPLKVYYFNDHYDLDEDAYNSYVQKTETFLQMIIYVYSIFICTFGFVGTLKSCLFFCNEYRYETYMAQNPRRRGLFFSRRIVPLVEESLLSSASILLQEKVSDDPCVICLEELEIGQRVIQHPSCKKLFHTACLSQYFSRTNFQMDLGTNLRTDLRCPLCRNSFSSLFSVP